MRRTRSNNAVEDAFIGRIDAQRQRRRERDERLREQAARTDYTNTPAAQQPEEDPDHDQR